jgi:hypothetical protein
MQFFKLKKYDSNAKKKHQYKKKQTYLTYIKSKIQIIPKITKHLDF